MKLPVPRIDFVARRSASVPGMALLVMGCVLAAVAVYIDASHAGDIEHLNGELRHAKKALQRTELRAKGSAGPIVEANVPADWPQRLRTRWDDLFRALERAQMDSIALLSIEPDADRHRVRLSGEAKDAGALIDYLKALGSSGQIADQRILMQQIKQDDPQHPVEFRIEARWNSGEPRIADVGKSS